MDFLRRGETTDCLISGWKWPQLRDRLTILVIVGIMIEAHSFRSQVGIGSESVSEKTGGVQLISSAGVVSCLIQVAVRQKRSIRSDSAAVKSEEWNGCSECRSWSWQGQDLIQCPHREGARRRSVDYDSRRCVNEWALEGNVTGYVWGDRAQNRQYGRL